MGFRHALVREVLVEELPAPERRSRHRHAAALLADREAEPPVIAEHWLRGGEPQEAIPWLLSSADASRRVHAYRDAADGYRRALEEDRGTLASRVAITERLAESAELAGSPAEASRAWERAAAERAEEGRGDLAAQAHARRARCLEVLGRWARGSTRASPPLTPSPRPVSRQKRRPSASRLPPISVPLGASAPHRSS